MIKTAFIFVLAITFASFTATAADQQEIGTIITIEGSATSPSQAKLEENDPIIFGETIATQNESRLVALLNDNTEITLGENTELTVDEFIYSPDAPKQNKGRFSILKGAFLFTSGLISKNEKPDVEINTGLGSIGIRGTTVWGGPIEGEYGILLQTGEVDIINEHGKVTLYPGQGAFIPSPEESPRKIGRWDSELTAKATRMVSIENREKNEEKLSTQKAKNLK